MTKAIRRCGGTRISHLGRLRCLGAALAVVCSTLVALPADAAAPNLVGNPSFEAGTTGWKVYNGSSIERVAGGADGDFALEIHGSDDLTTFGINDSPNWIETVAGAAARYRFTAKVRSEENLGSARLQIREYQDGTQRGVTVKTPPVQLTTSWQTITGDYVATTPSSTLDFQVLDIPVAPNETFQVDMVSILLILPDAPPVLNVDSTATVGEGETLGLYVTAEDPDGDPIMSLAADLSGLPAGANATFTPDPSNSSGMLEWTPTFDDAGASYTVRFFAGNTLAGITATEITVTNVDRAPSMEAPVSVIAQDSSRLVIEVSATDPDGEAIHDLVADLGQLPSGHDASFEVNGMRNEGILAWTPALGASGAFTIRFIASNSGADTLFMTISVARIEHSPALVVPVTLRTREGEAIDLPVSAFDPDGDAIASLSADLSALPTGSGAVFSTAADQRSGRLTWLPTFADAGSYEVVFTAQNDETISAPTRIEVENVDRAPVVSGPFTATVFEGVPVTIGIAAADPDSETIDLLRADLGSLPAGHGARFEVGSDRRSASFTWTPTHAELGTYSIHFTAANALTGGVTTTIVVRPPNRSPVAALVVSPDVGTAPTVVTASAKGSSDPDDPIASYRFDFGNGIVVGPQPGAVASAALATAGVHEITVIATDAFGAADTATARVCTHLGNLCTNPSFENSTAGWTAYGGSTITRVSGAGRTGSYALQAIRSAGSAWGFNDAPDWVPRTAGPGRTYRILAWVRSLADHGQASLRVQEFLGTAQKGVTRVSPPVTLSDAWQLLTVDYVVAASGTRLDMKILCNGDGAKFLIDDVQVLLLPVGDQPPLVMAPAAVTASAGQPLAIAVRAADPDGQPIATVAANLAGLPPGNDASWAPDAGGGGGTITWTPRPADVGPVPYGVTVTAANGLSTTVPLEIVVADAPIANLCDNPGFETSASGWTAYGSGTALTRVNSGHSGHFAIQLTHPSATGWGVNDQLDIVSSIDPGRTYRFTAWVRSPTSAGKVRMRVQEFLGTTQQGATAESPEVRLTNQWQRLAVSTIATTPGARLDMKIVNSPIALGEVFLVDDVEVLRMPAGDRPPVMTAPPAIAVEKQQPMTVSVTVTDPDGDAITTLAANLSELPASHNATFTPGPTNGTGILSWTPVAADARIAPYLVTFTATNGKNALVSTAITVTGSSSPNLCANPGFESGLSGWGRYGAATLARVSGGHGGGFALRMTTAGASSFGIDDTPNVVASVPAAGDRYRFSAWVRSDSSTSPVRLRVYEFVGSVQLGPVTHSYEVPASTTWQLVTVDHAALASGSTLSLRVTMSPTAAAQGFLVDDVSIRRLPADAAMMAGAVGLEADALGGDDGESLDTPLALEWSGETLAFTASFAPNPMRGEGVLWIALPASGPVRADLFDPVGRRVRTLMNESQARAGRYAIEVRSHESRLTPGVYFYRVDAAATGVRSGRVVVLE